MNTLSRDLRISQSYFNPLLLAVYDALVFGFVSKHIWGYPVEALLERYRQLVSDRHLEVGVGTGYLLDLANPPQGIKLDLMDLSASCLRKSKQRLVRYRPATYRHNVLQPCTRAPVGYRSIGVNYVMHCVPGPYKEKAIAFNHLKGLLASDGILFGSAVMGKHAQARIGAKLFLKLLNATGVFNNDRDEPAALEQGLRRYFRHVEVQVMGATALFLATDDPVALERSKRRI